MTIGLYFGSFNPIHLGHLIIANHVLNEYKLQQIWFVVSPQNPLKPSGSLLNENDRYHLVQLAIAEQKKFRASSIEFKLPKPSYTIDTMAYISEKYPQHNFSIIMGGDSIQNITKWKNYEALLNQYKIIVYNRPGFNEKIITHQNICCTQAPLLDISSTYVRQLIKEKKDIRFLVMPNVAEYIEANKYYST